MSKKNKPVEDETLTDNPPVEDETNDDEVIEDDTPPTEPTPEPPAQEQEELWDIRYFKNSHITSLSFVSLQGKMYSFVDGVFCTADPSVIERLQETEDYKHGFIQEFDPTQITHD